MPDKIQKRLIGFVVFFVFCLLTSFSGVAMQEYTVTGVVVSDAQKPIAQAQVRLYRIPPLPKNQPCGPIVRINPLYIESKSDQNGAFFIHEQWQGSNNWDYLIEVKSKGYHEYRQRLTSEVSRFIHIQLVLETGP